MKTLLTTKKLWGAWIVFSLALGAWLYSGIYFGGSNDSSWRAAARNMFVPDKTSSEHGQIEIACEVCHTKEFTNKEDMQKACLTCHEEELGAARDSHPVSKFTDPRNADRKAKLDATQCVTCHLEHRPQITDNMGVTLPKDFCYICHADVAKERPSHKDMAFDTCASAGCHNYHDNRALYEDFLLKHANDAPISEKPQLRQRDFKDVIGELTDYPAEQYPVTPLGEAEMDGKALKASEKTMNDWLTTAHAASGVNCSACHQQINAQGKMDWVAYPAETVCGQCHAEELHSFTRGKHGMRMGQQLSALTPELAELPMKKSAKNKKVACNTCHSAHRFDTRQAAVEGCLNCHEDKHSLAYKKSAHYRLWQKELAGKAPAGSGVSCASCHLPRIEFTSKDEVYRTLVHHNQSDNLRPNEKMIRPVCQNCHSLRDTINALADPATISHNFSSKPKQQIKGIDMAVARDQAHAKPSTSDDAEAVEEENAE